MLERVRNCGHTVAGNRDGIDHRAGVRVDLAYRPSSVDGGERVESESILGRGK